MSMWLIANDDGIHAPGLKALMGAVSRLSDFVVVAPDGNRSGYSNALTLDKPLRVEQVDDVRYAVNGTPTDCVHLAINGLLPEDPERVVSGINAGANLGDDALYSGTLAAAVEGRFLKNIAVAFSVTSWQPDYWADAAEIVYQVLSRLEALSLPERTVLNVNIPNLPIEKIRGFRLTRLGHRQRASDVQPTIDPRGRRAFWIGVAGDPADSGEGTDFHAIANDYVSITPLHADMTRYDTFTTMDAWLKGF
ncbi:MAG: 5'/3'-nucleotidase SurE [Alcanivoracaceae bacterium]|nr:5'/3'-nucleotidase SurE [Alcanivoracaceae bacterium]